MKLEPLSNSNAAEAVALARELHSLGTFGEHGPSFDWDWCMNTVRHSINDPLSYFMLARDDTGYVGAVCGKVVNFYFSPFFVGIEDAWYVRDGTPKRASIGIKLMRGFVDWCLDTKGALFVQSGDIAGIRTVGVDALYRHMGFTRFGMIYKYTR